MKTSLVTTILNEEDSIEAFLSSVLAQTVRPDEVIIVDGGSTDKTLEKIQKIIQQNKRIKVITKKGNRSIGRNEGVKQAKDNIILFTDAGCLLDKDWVKEIQKPFTDLSIDVVAGYYKDKSQTIFQKALSPYVLVMPDKLNPDNFLPATRSMAIRKHIFHELGGFNPVFSHNEDYVFVKRIQKAKKKIVFTPQAIVYWIPRRTFSQAYTMFWRFAFGDMEAGILRPKVLLLFIRYIIGLALFIVAVDTQNIILMYFLLIIFLLYIIWAFLKNYRYVKHWKAFYLLPLIQFVADVSVMHGSIKGLTKRYGL